MNRLWHFQDTKDEKETHRIMNNKYLEINVYKNARLPLKCKAAKHRSLLICQRN